jgi:hypothetical protein
MPGAYRFNALDLNQAAPINTEPVHDFIARVVDRRTLFHMWGQDGALNRIVKYYTANNTGGVQGLNIGINCFWVEASSQWDRSTPDDAFMINIGRDGLKVYLHLSTDGAPWNDSVSSGNWVEIAAFGLTNSFDRTVTFQRPRILQGIISPAQITASQNDYNPTDLANANILRLDTDGGSYNITGLEATGVNDGRLITLVNVDSVGILTLTSEDAASSAANRFSFNANKVINIGEAVTLWYDGTSSRWRPISDQ